MKIIRDALVRMILVLLRRLVVVFFEDQVDGGRGVYRVGYINIYKNDEFYSDKCQVVMFSYYKLGVIVIVMIGKFGELFLKV